MRFAATRERDVEEARPEPEEITPPNFPSLRYISFLWIRRYVILGWKRPLQDADLPGTTPSLSPDNVRGAEAAWEHERQIAASQGRRPSLLLAIVRARRGLLGISVLCSMITGVINTVARPTVQRSFRKK